VPTAGIGPAISDGDDVVADFPAGHDPLDIDYYGGHLVAESICHSNRALIAAAPDLLAVLEDALHGVEGNHPLDADIHSWQDAARSAIASAKGENK